MRHVTARLHRLGPLSGHILLKRLAYLVSSGRAWLFTVFYTHLSSPLLALQVCCDQLA